MPVTKPVHLGDYQTPPLTAIQGSDGNWMLGVALGSSADGLGENHIGQVGGRLIRVQASFTRPGDASPYAANDAVANSTSAPAALSFPAIARIEGGSGYLVGAEVSHEKAAVTPRLRLHLFNTAPTPYNDNAALAMTYAVVAAASYLGFIDFDAMTTLAGTDYSKAQNATVRLPFVCAAGNKTLYALLQTLDIFTPGNAKGLTVKLTADVN